MKSKIIYSKTKDAFLRELPNIPDNLNPLVFIEDTKEIWILGKYFSIGSPALRITDENNIITIQVGDDDFTLSSANDTLSIKKGTGNNIIFSGTALSSINTEYPLRWNSIEKKLFHEKVNVTPGSYGETSSSDNVNLITIPWFSVNEWGHLTNVIDRNIKIRDYVEQISSSNITGEYNILLGYSNSNSLETNPVRKATGLTFNNILRKLTIEGGFESLGTSHIKGDLLVTEGQIIGDVQGNVTGTATPKIHLSIDPEYGGASTNLYGHVKLQDDLIVEPEPSSQNIDINSATITKGIAASPKMVWDVKQELLNVLQNNSKIKKLKINDTVINSEDFPEVLEVKTEKGLSGGIDPITKELVFSSVEITGYDNDGSQINVENNLKFTKDFTLHNDELSIRWLEII